jgi:hypothetical protein
MNKILKRENSTMLVSIIGDEDTVTGMLLTGIGERNSKGETNFFKVNSSNYNINRNSCERHRISFQEVFNKPKYCDSVDYSGHSWKIFTPSDLGARINFTNNIGNSRKRNDIRAEQRYGDAEGE